MSESTSVGISNPILGMKKVGSIGIPIPDNDVKLVDVEDGVTEVPQGQPGEILMKGPVIMKEYWNNPEETANQLKDGWLYTGDIAIRDEDGYIFIVDRKKDMIIAGGFNIYPREIDEVLFQHPKIAEAVSLGVKDPIPRGNGKGLYRCSNLVNRSRPRKSSPSVKRSSPLTRYQN